MSLISDLTNREDEGSVIVDSDSMLFFSCYQFRDDWDEELVYMNFIERLGSVRTACYDRVSKLNDFLIAFTSSTNFRYKIYPEYKLSRKDVKDDAKLLKERVTTMKALVYARLKKIIVVSSVWEADDICCQYADKGYMVSALDKDVVNASPTPCYNYKKGEWTEGRTKQQITEWYLMQSIMGDTSDSIVGVKGIGQKGAEKFIEGLKDGIKTFEDYIDLFETPANCLLMNRLVRMNQYDKDTSELKLIGIEEVIEDVQGYSPF